MNTVSMILTTYNRPERFLREAIESIINQTLSDWELIIVDDGSTVGEPRAIADEYMRRDSRIHFIRQHNVGSSIARNTGMRHSKGEFIAFQDDDDISHPQRLEKSVAFLREHLDCGAVVPGLGRMGQDGTVSPKVMKQRAVSRPDLLLQECTVFPGMNQAFYRREALMTTGGFRAFFVIAQDIDMQLRFREKHVIHFMREPLYFHRTHSQGNGNQSAHPMTWIYVFCAYVSAFCRRNRLPCPIEVGKSIPDILAIAPPMFDDFPVRCRGRRFFRKLIQASKNELIGVMRDEQDYRRTLDDIREMLLRCGRHERLVGWFMLSMQLSVLWKFFVKRKRYIGKYYPLFS